MDGEDNGDNGEYNEALDNMEPEGDEDEFEVAEDTGDGTKKRSLDVAETLGLTEPPKPSAATQVLINQHPEIFPDYKEVVNQRLNIVGEYPPVAGSDPNHTTSPFLTLYERANILSFRSSQLAHGAKPFIEVPTHFTKAYDIAKLELAEKRLPFIIKRTLPDGNFEYWRLGDLMLI